MTMMYPGPYGAPPPPLLGPMPPRQGEAGWTVWPRRIWPVDPLAAAPRRMLLAAAVAGVIGTALWRPTVLSVGYLVVGLMVFGVVYGTADRRPTRAEWVGIGLTLALLSVSAVLAAEWVGGLCLVAAWVVAWCTLAGGHTWTAVFAGPFLPWLLPGRVRGWVGRGLHGPRSRSGGDIGPMTSRIAPPKLGRAAAVVGVTVLLALVFGGLFTAADPAFAHLVDNLVPEFDGGDIVARLVVAGIVVAFVVEGGYLIRFRPRLDDMAPAPMRPVPQWEWALPLGVLDALFIAFVAVQASVLFGGHTHVLETEGLTYAEYARQGFWQLLWVSGLTMLVLSAVIRVAGRATAADRRLLRVLVGTLCATSVVVVISAIRRMWVYQQAYGFSTERLMVITIEVWLGAVFLLVAAAGIRMSARWLPRAVLVAGVLALLGLAALNPERLIADRNIDRFEQTGQLDAEYLSRLSADIDPALHRLPDRIRACVTAPAADPDPWYLFNLSRSRADRAVDGPLSDYCTAFGRDEYSR
ncbi:DUF4153 domain-containing protein [Mycolicibacterium tusciae]|uniref:DUF4153 domain-containing protein n=1 Tax=Mycolicibacterium tusciae TaxID=75922 RepID=UPI00024A2619|nr:DUF4173 domain-containing protein [Mycolicibacterium tusciae]